MSNGWENVSQVDKFLDAVMGKLPPVAALLNASKRQTRIRFDESVYKAIPGFQILCGDAFAAIGVTGEYGRPQTEGGVVGHLNGLLFSCKIGQGLNLLVAATQGEACGLWRAGC